MAKFSSEKSKYYLGNYHYYQECYQVVHLGAVQINVTAWLKTVACIVRDGKL